MERGKRQPRSVLPWRSRFALQPVRATAGASAAFEPSHPWKKNQEQTRRAYLASYQVRDQARCRCSLSEKRPEAFDPPLPVLATHVIHPHRTFPHPLMIIRQRGISSLWLLLLLISAARSQLNSDCHLSIGDDKYDFSALKGDHTISRSRPLPPTNMTDTLRFNICNELSLLEGVSSGDQVRIRKTQKNTLTDDMCSVVVGRGRVLARQTSNKESRTELLQLFLLHRGQSCERNTPGCHVRSSSPWILGAR